jgi:hypothetical protein
MPQFNPETNQYEETPEERQKRLEQSQPGFFDKLGTALQTAGSNFVTNVQNAPENFVNNIKQGFDNVTNAPTNFANTVSNMVSGPVRPPVATTSPVQTPNIKVTEERIQQQPQFTPDYSLANQQNGPGMRYGQAFAPQEQPAQPAMPVQPVQPQQLQPRVMPQQGQPINNQQYNARVESGNNPNIGYHYPADQNGQRKSTAYGTYGITAPAYQDIQRTNPYFVNKPITSLTPDEQTQAYQTFTDLNKQQLQRVGVEPTDANLRLAHFLGANGAANYLKNGQISPQAAQANGGMERVQQLAQQKLAGVQAPTSGASLVQQPVQQVQQPVVEQPTPVQQGITAYQTAQNNINDLLKLTTDQNQPEFIRNRAGDRALQLYDSQKKEKQAGTDLQNKTPAQLATILQGRDKSSLGDWMQYLLFKHVGLNDLANEKGDQLGIGHKWQGATDGAGNNGLIRYGASGMPLEGVKSDNTPMTSEELAQYASQASVQKGTQTHTGKMQDVTTGEVFYERTTPNGIELVDNNGKRYKGASNNLRPFGIGSDIQTRNQIQLNELQNKLAFAGPTERAKIVAENEAKFGALDPAVRAQALGTVTGTVPTRPQQGQAPVVQGQAPVVQGQAPVVQGQQPVTTIAPAVTTIPGVTPQVVRPAGQTIAQREAQQTTGIKRTESFNKILDEEVRPQAQAGDTVSSTRKQQFAIFDRPGVDTNKIFGLYNASSENPNDQKLSIVRDIFGGTFKPEAEVSQRLALLNLSPQEKSALMEYNIANQRINAATLKQTAGPGSVSDAEQRANRESNVDPTKIPALGAYNAMAQSQFNGDLARYKADWADTNPATNALQLDKAWRKESANLAEMYGNIAKQRNQFIASNGATTAAVREGYRKYPIPEYDPNSGTWKKTKPLAEILGR